MLVSGSHTEDQWVGDLSDPGTGLPGGWTSQCVRLCSRVRIVVLSFLYMTVRFACARGCVCGTVGIALARLS